LYPQSGADLGAEGGIKLSPPAPPGSDLERGVGAVVGFPRSGLRKYLKIRSTPFRPGRSNRLNLSPLDIPDPFQRVDRAGLVKRGSGYSEVSNHERFLVTSSAGITPGANPASTQVASFQLGATFFAIPAAFSFGRNKDKRPMSVQED
jgi:hypothetical protein